MARDIGYSFATARTANGCVMVQITPCSSRGRLRPKVYVFTPDEVRALVSCIDILDD